MNVKSADRYVPLIVAGLLDLDDETTRQILENACVELGEAIEIDTFALERCAPDVGRKLRDYFSASLQLWDALAAGKPAGTDTITVERVLVQDRQVDTRDARVFLADTAEHLELINGLEVASGLLDKAPKWTQLRRKGTLKRKKAESTYTIKCPARHYPETLGGVRSRGETARYLTMTSSHTAWRDSRARRLTSVTVTSHEIWPDPHRWDND